MNSVRYVGLDVHRDTISVAVLDESGRLMMESVLATRAAAILDFIHGVRGTLHVTFEEGTHSAWLYDLLVRRLAKLVVCNPRKNALLKSGSKSDAIDARKLAELLRAGMLSAVYHGETSGLEVQHVARSYSMLTEDTTREMGRLKAVFRGQAGGLRGQEAVREAAARGLLSAVGRGRAATEGGVSVSGTGCFATAPSGSAARVNRGVPQACGCPVLAVGTVSGTDSGRAADRSGADAAPLPHQASVLGVLRTGAGDARQRGISRAQRAGGT